MDNVLLHIFSPTHTSSSQLGMGASGRLPQIWQLTLTFHKMYEISRLAKERVSQEGLCLV